MIKLKELLELRGMVYSEEIKPKHQEKIHMKTSLWDENIILPRMMPPENDSSLTLKEVKHLASIKPNEEMAHAGDDVQGNFLPLIEKYNLPISEELIDRIIKESAKFIMDLKYKFNRPRPYQVAEFYGIDLNGTQLDSMKTPSFPSGHAVQGYLIGEYLAKFDNVNAYEYRMKGEEIAQSRIIAKAHYPSDKEYGKVIAKALLNGMKK
tara:strand:+ start:1096 stop:1719 length:624 start_codon:yes stop_codon:yes gene_type:complete